MKLEHLACYVKDLELMKTFYMKYFNAIPNEKYHNPRTGLMTYFLTFEEGATIRRRGSPSSGRNSTPSHTQSARPTC